MAKDPAATLRAAQNKAARDIADHDSPILATMLEKLEAMTATAGEIVAIIPTVVTPYLPAQVASMNTTLISLRDAVQTAIRECERARTASDEG